VLKYLVAAIILAIPLYPKFPFITVPGTYVSIRLEDFLIAIVAIVWVVTVIPIIGKFIKNDINRAIMLFFMAGIISVLFAALVTNTITLQIGILHWARRIEYMLMFFVGVAAIYDRKNLKFYISCLGVVIVYAFVYGVAQKYFGLPIITTQNSEYSKGIALLYRPGGHLVSTFAGHYDLASLLIVLLPIFIGMFAFVKSSKIVRFLVLLIVLCGLWLLVNTASRISIASYFISATISLIILRKYLYILLLGFVSFLFVAFSTSLISRYMEILTVTLNKLGNILVPEVSAQEAGVIEDRSTSIRLNVEWPRALRALTKNPLLGTGFSSITLATDNDYLRMLGEMGILGFTAFILIFIRIWRRFIGVIIKLGKDKTLENAFIAGMIGAQFGVAINAIFIDIFEASKFAIIYWLLMGITIGLIAHKNEKKVS
jgi:O-antigen ligase